MIVALSGGIGGAKLALGLSHILPPADLTVVANIGDDFEHLGLSISPDLDTLTYTLAGLDNPVLGWGRRDETWSFMETLESLGGETWFRLGDRDLALHLERTRRLHAGETLSEITDHIRHRLGIGPKLLPASNDHVRTQVLTEYGWIGFQDYFVRQRAAPRVHALEFAGADVAQPHPDVIGAISQAKTIVICPSNPFISIDPILAISGVRDALHKTTAPVIAISPIIGGRAVKGPTAKIMAELGLVPSAIAVAEHYGDLLDAYVADRADVDALHGLRTHLVLANTLMTSLTEKQALAQVVLETSAALR
jgi:LPPG:FO 2-phospho-L-lactate transferase